jgi:hypothetical protein
VSFFLSSNDRFAQQNIMTKKAYEIGLPIVGESYFFDCIQNNKLLDMAPYLIKQNTSSVDGESGSEDEGNDGLVSSEEENSDRVLKRETKVLTRKKEDKPEPSKKKDTVKLAFSPFPDEIAEIDLKLSKKEVVIQQNLLFQLSKMVSKEKFPYSDIIFAVGNDRFYSCRAILASRSRYFKELFEKLKQEVCTISYPVEPNIFSSTLVWITTGVLEVENTYSYLSIASHADKLGLLDLKEYSLIALERKVKEITSQNIMQESLQLWDLLLNSQLPVEQSMLHPLTEYIGSKLSLLVTDSYFYKLSPKGMMEILKNTNMNVEESVLFDKLVQWAGCQLNNKFPLKPIFFSITEQLTRGIDANDIVMLDPKAIRNYLVDYLQYVLFEHLSQEAILTRIEPSRMFTEKEILEMTKASLSQTTGNYTLFGRVYTTKRKKRNFTSKPLRGPVVFQYTLNKKDIFNRIDYPVFELYGMEWFVSSQGEYGNYLGLFLYNKLISNGTMLNDSPITTSVSFRMKNRNKEKNKTGTFSTEWRDRKAWGFSNFIEKKHVLESEHGWMDHRGNIQFEISIERK